MKILQFWGMACVVLWFAVSCLGSDDFKAYNNAWGYVSATSPQVKVTTSAGYDITSDELGTNWQVGDVMMLSFQTESNLQDKTATAHNVSYTALNKYGLTAGTAMAVADSAFVTGMSIPFFSPNADFGDHYFLKLNISSYDGFSFVPYFYYTPSVPANFDVNTDSIVVDVRLQVQGSAKLTISAQDTTKTSLTGTAYLAADLSAIRSLFRGKSDYIGKRLPIYFRYAPSLNGRSVVGYSSAMYISE